MSSLYCHDCGNYLMASDGECHDCVCGWKQPVECHCSVEEEESSPPPNQMSSGTFGDRVSSVLDEVWNLVSFPLAQPEQAQIRQKIMGLLNEITSMRGKPTLETIHQENEALKAELKHWKANHANVVKRLQLASQRPDLPADRVSAINELLELQNQVSALEAENKNISEETDIGKAVNNVCGSLPGGCGVVINLERGAGKVVLVLADGNEIDIEDGVTFADKINNAVKQAEQLG